MADIISFPGLCGKSVDTSVQRSKIGGKKNSAKNARLVKNTGSEAELLFFTGIRYERMTETTKIQKVPNFKN